ncbi:penicillin-binding protein 1A [Lentilactobacillus fungorum]|uniref:Penicillin-binding protein 1A n=1 Tax=Lentilactobacillus fungorum TaxID=2201250 RepID=A0ABQ3VWV5_9LACO|nr:PBP1A family penicillin-binding protein [Lentilactobacillus fungorum]GHP12792.1 penicillin-binding protein 1A [Lentilactobacillus fungorum]
MSQNSPKSRTKIRRGHQFAKKQKSPFKRIIKYLLILFGLVILFGAGLFTFYASSAPQITRSALSSDNSTKFYDANGQVISRLGSQNRDYVKSKNIPKTLKQAVVSIEDRRFYKHHGVDPIRIIGATISNVTGSSLGLQGGSTLTQQLVKLSVFSTAASDRTLKRKAQEAWLALKIERQYSKSQILEFYINKVYMGNGVYGMQTAAEYYYNKTLKNLTLPEFALLAGMPQSPTLYNPYKYPKYATERRNEVLNAMVKNKVITQAQSQSAKNVSVKTGLSTTHAKAQTSLKTSKYIDAYLKQTLQELRKKGYKQNSGLKVYTNLDLNAQKKLYQVANGTDSGIAYPSKRFQMGATLVDPNNGQVLAMQGGRNVKVAFGLNRAVQTGRSSGSTAKPIMDYGPAIQYLKYPTYQPVKDTPYTYAGSDKSVMDFDNKYQGTITMRKALVESRNIPAIRTLENVGINQATTFLKKLGMSFSKPLELQNGIGLYISTEQLAASYAAFSNGGIYYKPYLIRKIVQPNGETHQYQSQGKRAMSPATAFMITNMLKGVMTDSNGSGTAAKVAGLYEAGKTGTTQYPDDYLNKVPADSSMDSWFSGYTKNYSLAIWTGYDHQFQANSYISQPETTIAQEIYKSVMGYISTNKPNVDWTKPDDVVATDRGGTTEYYVAGYPNTVSDNSSSQTTSGYTVDSGSSSSDTTVTQPRSNESSESSDRTTESSQTPTTQEPSGNGGDSSSSSSASSSTTDSTGGNTTDNNSDSSTTSPDTNTNTGTDTGNDTTNNP